MTDVFDGLLNSTCDIKEKGHAAPDSYGQPSQALVTVVTGVKCRISRKGGREWKVEKEFAKNNFDVYMRPPLLTDASAPFRLTEKHWLLLKPVSGETPFLVNITNIGDPSGLGHHLELDVERIVA